ncbi:MAG: hypothetical protein QM778_26595 [Myxococcales bacterium]
MVKALRILGLLSLFGVALAACAAPRCEPEEACDIRQKSCQKRALRWAKCLREADAKLDVDVKTVSAATLIDDRTRESEAGSDPHEDAFQKGLSLLDLAALRTTRESVADQVHWLGASYDPSEKSITVVDHGHALDTPGYMFMLVHEFVHALQDESGGLSTPTAPTYDAHLAMDAIVEGEATVLEDEAASDGLGFDFGSVDYERILRDFRQSSMSDAKYSESFMDAAYREFSYAFGASYLWERPGYRHNARIAYKRPPVSTFAVMEGDPEHFDAHPNDLGEEAVPVLDGLGPALHMHLGRFVYEGFTQRFMRHHHEDLGALPRSPQRFLADTFSVFERGGEVLVSWRVRFDDEGLCAQGLAYAFSQIDEAGRGYRVLRRGTDAILLIASDSLASWALPEDLEWTSADGPDFGIGLDAAPARTRCALREHR